jgi:hypothetical protein
MFNLDKALSEWRKQMIEAGIKAPALLDELEGHLREDVRTFLAAGEAEDRAFQLSVSRLGSPDAMEAEFKKIKAGTCAPVRIGSWLWTAATIGMAAFVSRRLFGGKWNALLAAHVLTITAGYGAAFLTGIFGVFYVCWRSFGNLSAVRRHSLGRAAKLFGRISAALVLVGCVLGSLWSGEQLGRYWIGDAREIGGYCAAAWLAVLWVVHRLGLPTGRATMLMCIGSNGVIGLAWFGGGIFDHNQHAQRLTSYWPLAIFLGINLCLLAVGLVPESNRKRLRPDA